MLFLSCIDYFLLPGHQRASASALDLDFIVCVVFIRILSDSHELYAAVGLCIIVFISLGDCADKYFTVFIKRSTVYFADHVTIGNQRFFYRLRNSKDEEISGKKTLWQGGVYSVVRFAVYWQHLCPYADRGKFFIRHHGLRRNL